ncbi:MAG: biotin--[acetyl-CoA-carboxylase] ligase [Synergistaceae bacterium]|nr:biotin--[acetyl-CoA-carboxylase] ligase [Synergistaceae bacterium]
MVTEKFWVNLSQNDYFREIICLETVSNTQDYLKLMAQNGKRGLVCVARHQTNGLGRAGRKWYSDEENLKFSMLFDACISPQFLPIISLIVGMVVKETIEKLYLTSVQLKWPNDILLNGKKICGIISESASTSNTVKWIVCGVGVNLNMKKENIPADLHNIATSLLLETNLQIEENKFLEIFLVCFSDYLRILEQGGSCELIKKYQSSCDTIGKKINVILENETRTGIASKIDEHGALVVKTEKGEEVFCSADIVHIR